VTCIVCVDNINTVSANNTYLKKKKCYPSLCWFRSQSYSLGRLRLGCISCHYPYVRKLTQLFSAGRYVGSVWPIHWVKRKGTQNNNSGLHSEHNKYSCLLWHMLRSVLYANWHSNLACKCLRSWVRFTCDLGFTRTHALFFSDCNLSVNIKFNWGFSLMFRLFVSWNHINKL
jgi:hypothetical protein